MIFIRRIRLVAVSACLCALALVRLDAQTPAPASQNPSAPAEKKPAKQSPETPKSTSPFESVPQAPAEQQPPSTPAPKPATAKPGQPPQMEQPKAPEAPKVQPGQDQAVEAIEFRGARRVPQDTLKALILTKRGDLLSDETLRRDFMALWNTGRFDDIRVETEPGRAGIILRYVLVERRVVRSINYEGVKSLTVSEILDRFKERKVGLSVESQYDPNKVQHAAVVLKEYLAERGRQFATVQPEIQQIPPSSLKVVFNVKEGPKVKVGVIDIQGNKAFDDKWVIRAMKNLRPIGLPHSILFENIFTRTYDSAKLEEDKDRIRQAYQDKGYFTVRILEGSTKLRDVGSNSTHGFKVPVFHLNLPGKYMDVHVPVEEGRLYKLRQINFAGVKLFRTPETLMKPLFQMGQGDIFSTAKLKKGLENMRKLYGEFGYIDFVPEPSFEPVPNTDQIDLTLTADEGKQFFIRRIDFSGNTTTRDKVIRREIMLDEGDMFNTRLWDVSVLRLNQLGYFEMLKEGEAADIKRNPQSNTVDITLKVKERGKNSIGLNGGVSGISGTFVGFNYSTNNFLGLGETLSLESQLGTRTADVSIGFTEPYFLDRPLQLGFVVFMRRFSYNQAREVSILSGQNYIPLYNAIGSENLLNYVQNARGFSVSASYPLRRSFARLGITYGFEISSVKTKTTAAATYFDYINFNGVGGPNQLSGIRTSKITPSYTYNTVNHPITPTAGKSLFASVEFAGSVLGGNVNTIRPAIDAKYFKQSPLNKNHILAFHLAGSMLAGYGGKVAPPYSRTYIGGEQDIRGFETWGVSPVAFVASTATINVLNADGTARTQTYAGATTNMTQSLPIYQLVFPGGDTQVVLNSEYRIPIVGPVILAPFVDWGMNKIVLATQLKQLTSRVDYLNGLYPQAGFDGQVKIAPGTQRPRMSTGLELQVMLPVVNAPFRVYYAYNPMTVREYVQPPIVADRAMFPNYQTWANAVLTYGQTTRFFEKRGIFRFTIGRTF
jgi:outer membrane protein insertion porin family